jgi:hypothetical protein
MPRPTRLLILLAVLLTVLMGAAAQDEQVIGDPDGFSLSAPASWDVRPLMEGVEDAYYWVSDSGYGIIIMPQLVDDVVYFTEETDDYAMLQNYLLEVLGFEADEEFIVPYETEYYYGVAYQGTSDDGLLMDIVAMAFEGPYFLIFELYAPEETFDAASAEFAALVNSFLVGENALIPHVNAVALSGEDAACFASAPGEAVALLHVGPDEERAGVAFLPLEVEAAVLGQTSGADGGQWLRLDNADAAPDSAATEIWVDAANVITRGDCQTLTEFDPRPVPLFAGGSIDDEPEVDRTLQSGAYTLVFPPEFPGSCTDGTSSILNTADIFGSMADGLDADLTYTGDSIDMGGGDIVYRVNSQTFTGSFDLGGGEMLQARLTITSETTFIGELTQNFTRDDGVECSVTLPFSSRTR